MPQPDITLVDLLASYQSIRPTEIATLMTIITRIALPAWRQRKSGSKPSLAGIPAHRLYALLDGPTARWQPAIAATLAPGQTYQHAYPRAIRRLLTHGEVSGLIHPDLHRISPAWRALLNEGGKVDQVALVAEIPPVNHTAARWSMRKLARWATEIGVEPADVPTLDSEGRVMAGFKAVFSIGTTGGFYQARKAWNTLRDARPDLGLARWEAEATDDIAALPQAEWPTVIAEGLRCLFDRGGLGAWKAETRQGYTMRLASYLGVLKHLGIDPAALLGSAPDGVAALRLLFQGMVPSARGMSAAIFADRMTKDPAFAASIYVDLAEREGSHEGRASEANPLLLAAIRAHADRRRVTSARDLLIKAGAMNRGFLGITERHTAWLSGPIQMLDLAAKRNPSAYAVKKRRVFRHPDLWLRLVGARDRLRHHTAELEAVWREAPADEAGWRKLRWATALRNEVMFGTLLCYPLRVGNLVGMKLGQHYDADNHAIFFEAHETKNEREIDYELPTGGSLGDLRGLVDSYLLDARPALLNGRLSPYMFVPGPQGGTHMRTRAVNVILVDLSVTFFSDVLPTGVAILNPHLIRHAAASFHLAIRKDLNMAAQMLNDSPATILKSYADLLDYKKEATKQFLSTFNG